MRYVEQINEALCKVLYHNLFVLVRAMHELSTEPIFRERLGLNNRRTQYIFHDAMYKLLAANSLPYTKLTA